MAKNNFYKIDGNYARENYLVSYVDIVVGNDDIGQDVFETVPVVILDDCVFHQVFSFDEHDVRDLFFLCTSTPDLFQKYDFVEKTKDY